MTLALLRWVGVSLVALSGALAGACGSPIVGAECRDGFVSCDGVCVDLASDPDHCGTCEESCGAFTCEESECTSTPRPDGGGDGDGDGDGDRDAGGSGGRDAGESPIGTGNPFEPDASFNFPDPGAGGCPIGTRACGGRCVDTESDVHNCGGCGILCAAGELCALGICTDVCPDSYTKCPGRCANLQTDPLNCGRCGRVCRSGICEAGQCADTIAGNVTVMGHDFSEPGSLAARLLATNSLNRAKRTPIRVLLFRDYASTKSVNGALNALEVGSRDRQWREIPATAAELTFTLFAVDALVIPPQDTADDARLIELGQMWSVALAQFLARGGVILLLDTQTDRNAGTFQILEPSGLFAAEARRRVRDGTDLTVDLLAPAITGGVTARYAASSVTVAFDGVSTPGDVVVRTPDDRPVVIHRLIAP